MNGQDLLSAIQTGQGHQYQKTVESEDARKKLVQDLLNQMHGAANSKNAAAMRDVLARAQAMGDAGDIQNIYNRNIQDAEAQERAAREAEQRKIDVGNQKNALINQYGDQARRQLASNIAQSRRNASARGMLYSSQLQGNVQAQRSQAAGAMAGYRSQVNKASDDQLGQLAQQSAQRGIQSYENNISARQNEYQDALSRYKQKAGIMGGIGKGIGAAAGAFLPF